MQHLQQIHPGIYQYNCLHFSPQELGDAQRIGSMIERDLQLCGLQQRQLQNRLVIINFLGEAISASMAQPLADTLRALGAKVAGVFMVPNTNKVNYPWQVIAYWCADNSEWFTRFQKGKPAQFDLSTDRHLICLNRRQSTVRSQVVDWLIDNVDKSKMILSYETHHTLNTDRQRLLDGAVDEVTQHRPPPDSWLRAAIKLITEGNEQGFPNVPETMLVSEKTFKCFAWRQFPLWVSIPGTVQAVREMGFDVFDDLFDHHTYDAIQEQDQRVKAVLEQVKFWVKQPIWKAQNLRQRHHRRLQRNFLRLTDLALQRHLDMTRIVEKYAKMFADKDSFRV